ncbi:uncharacterized protein [Physcomitrium patens]|uniref:Thioredoxin domain-containing protein n=1 Tax=Physcomitrium patens TaxID=3218 RepID=A0A2K1KF62_PHYPA|nr:uncharacterized protein LOC112283863 isoform X1 [Physcomitrium patens]PNR52389.1 hypothetical protein PHYPA_008763 [Physcomitrium patens]|eukprot:XP_024378901.1 uncharacterized protein LOC112283863 isoform X1 [Physcomitrella patens]
MAMTVDARVSRTRPVARSAPVVRSWTVSNCSSPCLVSVKLRALLVFRGLRIESTRTTLTSHSSSRGSARSQRKGIVCEAQKTVTGVARAVTEATWTELVLNCDTPVLVDFWAPWCGPCRMIAPMIDEIAKQYAGKVRCLKLNTDESPDIATKYGIRSIPTVLVFTRGEKRDSVVGAVPKSTLTSTIDKYISW